MLNHSQADWQDEDDELEQEFGPVLALVREQRPSRMPPGSLDRQIRRLAAQRREPAWKGAWILGQGPLVILVISILFAISVWILSLG